MAIRYEDSKDDGAKPAKTPVKAPAVPAPVTPEAETEAEGQLPFAKQVRPEKKKRGR